MPDPALLSEKLRPLRRLAGVVFVAGCGALGLALIATLCWLLVPPVPHSAAFIARYAVLDGFLYSGQPAKTAAFQACVVAAPLLIALAWLGWRRFELRMGETALRRLIKVGLILDLILFAASVRPLFYYPHPPLWLSPTWLLVPLPFPPSGPAWEWIVCVLAGFTWAFWVIILPEDGSNRRGVTFVLFLFALIIAPVEFYAPSEITDNTAFTYHLNAMLDAVSQSVNGHHLLVDFPHIYGGYGEMLAPFLRLFPRTIAVPLVVLAVPTVLAIFCWLLAARLVIRRPALLALVGTALLAVTILSTLPPNYCYGTPRSFFPALGLWLAALYLKRPTSYRYLLASGVAAIASVWNLDTGLVLWLAWTLTLLAGEAACRRWGFVVQQLGLQTIFLGASWTLFVLYLRLASGQWPDPHLLFYFQAMVVEAGYFCVPLIVPSAWIFLCLLYLLGLVVAAVDHACRRVKWRSRLTLLLSLAGLGMFSYYLGRSAETNLIAVCPPGILLAGLLAGGAETRIRLALLPSAARWFFLPWLVMIGWWAVLLFVNLPGVLGREVQLARDCFAEKSTSLQVNGALARSWLAPQENGVYILSGHSGFYYYLTDTTRFLPIPGNIELLQMRDMDALIGAIRSRSIRKLIVDQNFYDMQMYRPDIYALLTATIARNYQSAKDSPDHRVKLYLPRPQPGAP